ncbi:ABC transporter substrate-binding protein [Nocardioides baekrokdamisoli]|uniref:ABC transporter substrate-binding protein n=1 Tax=Nocardioides baekrokdamisoli TaxID=1804624 RepID=A0A3G9IPN8_9ACTN|nr:helix-turn-helix domain-containing protein [Nocardioides baekrokdamisoli]BBH18025.1 ABC transporter substrate-binding protein [Nocardioides baekrokdamisoli]
MDPRQTLRSETEAHAASRIREVARSLGTQLISLGSALLAELPDSIPELRGDPLILDLLRASVESNIETFLHLVQHSIAIDNITPPAAAIAYAHRLAQRGTSSNALVRAYRLGQRRILDLSFAEIAHQEPDLEVAYEAARLMHDLAFRYVDQVSEKVVAEYESELERWMANRNTVRATMLAALIDGQDIDVAAAESTIGYRLRQRHLGVVLWDTDRSGSTDGLRRLETVAGLVGDAVGSTGQPLFLPQDRSQAWAWIPMGRAAVATSAEEIERAIAATAGSIRVALGTVGAAIPGFRSTHLEALKAHTVATIADDRAAAVTTYAAPGVRAAALLTRDIESARNLVVDVLGPLAADDEAIERLRETLLVFLSEGGSFRTAGELLHVHRNTVKYRIDRATEVRGRDLTDDRFNLELALLACHWLGRAVLTP